MKTVFWERKNRMMNINHALIMLAAEAQEYEGLAEAPLLIKFIFASVALAVVFAIIAIIYCAVTPMKRKKFK